MNRFFKKIIGALLSSKGQIWLLFLLLALSLTVRFAWLAPKGITLDRLGFAAETSQEQGIVVYSRKGGNQLLLLNRGNLFWQDGEDTACIAEDVLNLYYNQGRIWVRTSSEIAEVNLPRGTADLQIGGEGLKTVAGARLVGVLEDRFFLDSGESVLAVNEHGLVEGPYYLEGKRRQRLIEPDWRSGVAFIQGNAWIVARNFRLGEPVPVEQGELMDVLLSPDAREVVYAVQKGPETEIWYAQVNGTGAELLYRREKHFSSLEALWSPDLQLVAITVLGYQEDAGFDDEFISSTFLYQPGRRGIAVLAKSQGGEVRALVPTTWDRDGEMIWFYWLHEEETVPVFYRLFRQ